MNPEDEPRPCVFCKRSAQETPLIEIRYRDSGFSICPQHLPVLIHQPEQLIGKLPGAEGFKPADIHD